MEILIQKNPGLTAAVAEVLSLRNAITAGGGREAWPTSRLIFLPQFTAFMEQKFQLPISSTE